VAQVTGFAFLNPDYALGLRHETPKPKEISTLAREAYLKDMVTETKWVKRMISKGFGGAIDFLIHIPG
jgi:hypothetical protein